MEPQPDFALVWSRPSSQIASFARLLQCENVPLEAIMADVQRFCQLLIDAGKRLKGLLVATWVLAPSERGWGMLDLKAECGVRYALMKMNLQMIEFFSERTQYFCT